MAVPQQTTWDISPHTVAKHELLKLYLQRWFPILNSRHGRIIYVDGFCGPGRYNGGEPGSPIVVLNVAANHIKTLTGDVVFLFIDERLDRVEHLQSEIKALGLPSNFNIKVYNAKFDEKLKAILDRIDQGNAPLAPTFIFVDPFGFSGVPYELIRRALEKPRCEVLVTFMADSINRFIDHPQDKIRYHIEEIFGTRVCFDINKNAPNRVVMLRDLYQKQLQQAARFVRYFEMRDRTGRVEYWLFFATNNELGHVKMKEAMWATDPTGAFRFSDATDPHQQVLFGTDHPGMLWKILHKEFAGKGVLTNDVLKFVNDRTAFLDKHMKATLKEHENPALPSAQQIQVRELKTDGSKRRRGTFPDGVFVTFPA